MGKAGKRTRTVSTLQLQQNASGADKARQHERENKKAAKLEQMRKDIYEYSDAHRDHIEDAYEYVVERHGQASVECSADKLSQFYKHVKKIAATDLIKLLLVHVTKLSEQQLQAVKRIEGEDVYRLLYAVCLVQPLRPFGPADKEAWSREYRERARVADVGVAERLSL
eukprot:3331319-Amphidinium_carterae.1